jgi:hypothetical protein
LAKPAKKKCESTRIVAQSRSCGRRESILGDLQEEFSLLAASSGTRAARNWYWRQTSKTLPRLANFAFRTVPWMTLVAVAGGLLLRKLVAPLVGSVGEPGGERCSLIRAGFIEQPPRWRSV